MKKLIMVAGVIALVGMTSGCATWKEMQECQAREEAEMAKKGPVRYFLEKEANPDKIAKARAERAFDPEWREALDYCVSSYIVAVASLEKVQVVADGAAAWERALNAYSEKIKKERSAFTQADNQAAYNDLVALTQSKNATAEIKKDLVDVNSYMVWGKTLDVNAAAAARKRNADFVKAVVKYTAHAKRIAYKFKRNRLKYFGVLADGLRGVGYLSLAGRAAELEANVMQAAKDGSLYLKTVNTK